MLFYANSLIMKAIELRSELFCEMSPLLGNESAMTKMLAFVKSLVPAKKGISVLLPIVFNPPDYPRTGPLCS